MSVDVALASIDMILNIHTKIEYQSLEWCGATTTDNGSFLAIDFFFEILFKIKRTKFPLNFFYVMTLTPSTNLGFMDLKVSCCSSLVAWVKHKIKNQRCLNFWEINFVESPLPLKKLTFKECLQLHYSKWRSLESNKVASNNFNNVFTREQSHSWSKTIQTWIGTKWLGWLSNLFWIYFLNMPIVRVLLYGLPNLFSHFNELFGKAMPKLLESYNSGENSECMFSSISWC